MKYNDLLEFLAICDKIKIEQNPYISKEEKEFWKQFIDYIKDQGKQNYGNQVK